MLGGPLCSRCTLLFHSPGIRHLRYNTSSSLPSHYLQRVLSWKRALLHPMGLHLHLSGITSQLRRSQKLERCLVVKSVCCSCRGLCSCGLVPGLCVRLLTFTYNSSHRESNASFWSPLTPALPCTHTYSDRHINTHK